MQYTTVESWTCEDGIVKSGSQHIDSGYGIRSISNEKTGFSYGNNFNFNEIMKAAKLSKSIIKSNSSQALNLKEYSDFEKIKTYFTYPVTLSLFGDPVIVNNEKDLMNWYKKIRNDVQEGYKYSMLEKSRVIWISKDICMVDATYSRFNASYERIFTGRGIYMYKKVDKTWKMFSMSGVELNKNKK